ncbi:hypothetical protein CRE_05852 [Caenorhabditis remanei]|uniref:Tyrosine-protein phosphatase domain-containing protein n=1 Tax=Caenorhabditis remanei TaxID=31234 RepID=E3MNQ2_CAERE|nr:hypothetical protein CRE_05852 [Caenorhabditis remanei]
MRQKLLLLATLSLLGVIIHGFVPHRPYGSPPPPSNNWSHDADSNNAIGSYDSDRPSDMDLHRYRNPRNPNAHLSPISPSDSADSAHHYRIRRTSNGKYPLLNLPLTLTFSLPDAFSTTVDKMLKISRVINGIALQQDITNDTVKPDVVIKELLDLTQWDFGNLDELSKVVEAIQGLSGKLNEGKSTETDRMEKRFRLYSQILEATKGIKDKVELPDKDAYLKEITDLKAKQVSLSVLTDVNKKLTEMSNVLTKLLDSKQQLDVIATKNQFRDFKRHHQDLNDSNIDTLVISIKSPQLRKDMFGPLDGIQKVIDMFTNKTSILRYSKTNDKTPTTVLQGYMKQIGSISADSVKVLESMRNLEKLVRSHRFGGNRVLDQTSGFPNGFPDVELIPKDLIDPWVMEAVDGQSVALAKSMEDLNTIARKGQSTLDFLKSASSYSHLLIDLVDTTAELSSLQNTFEPLASNLLNMSIDAKESEITPDNKDKFDGLLLQINSLRTKLVAMDTVLGAASNIISGDFAERMKKIEEYMTYKDDKEVPDKLAELRKYEGAKDVSKLLLGLKESLTVLVDPVSIDSELAGIQANFTEIDTFVGELSTLLKYISSMRAIDGSDKIKPALDAIDKYRNEKKDFGEFGKLKDHLSTAKNNLDELSKSFDGMKGAKNPESKALAELSDVWKDSQSIGSATRVFRGIKLMLEWTEDVVTVAAKKLIQDNSKTMSPEDQENLKQLDKLDGELNTLKSGLTAISADPVMSKTDSNLASFSPVYTLASKTNGLKYDFKSMSDSVDRLAKSLNNDKDLLDVKSKLDKLDSMGLDYAKHHSAISGVKKSLENLDLFFAAFNGMMTPVVVTVPTQPPGQTTPRSVDSGPTVGMVMTTAATSVFTSPLFLGGVAGALFIAVLILVGYFIYRKYKDNEDEYQKPVPQFIFDYFVNEIYFKYNYFGAKYNASMSQAAYFKVYFQHLFDLDSSQTKQLTISPSVLKMTKYTKRQAALSKTNRLTLKSAKAAEMFGSNFIHGNMIFDDKKKRARIAVLQAPQLADKATDAKETVGMFYWAAMEQKCELMVCLTPTGPGGLCAQYFPAEKGGVLKFENGLVVTCEKVEEICGGGATRRILTVKFPGKGKFTLNHIQFETWTGDSLPSNWKPLVEIMQMVRKEKQPVFIHCTDGLKQSAVMALAIMNKELLIKQDGDLVMGTGLNNLRHVRSNAIITDMDYLNVAMLSFELFLADQERENFDEKLEKKVKTIEDNIDAITGGRVNATIDATLVAAMKEKETAVKNAVGKKEGEENKEEKKSGDEPSDKTKKKKAPSSMSKVSEQKEEKSLDRTQETEANTGPLAEEIKQHHFSTEKMEELIQADFDRFKAHANMMKKRAKKVKKAEKKSLNAIDDTESLQLNRLRIDKSSKSFELSIIDLTMHKRLLLIATFSLLGVYVHGFVPHRPYGSPPPPSNNWSPDADNNNVIGPEDSDRPSDMDILSYSNPRNLNARLSTISPSDDSAHYYRIRRASDDAFSTTVDKMLKISRVINGIALQQDITNGTVKPDVVIKELLDLTQLDFGNLEEMSKVIEAFQGLPEALSKDKDRAERIEKRFRMYDNMLGLTKGAGDKVALPDKDAYSGEITALKQKKVPLSDFKTINEKLTGMADKLAGLLDSKQKISTGNAKIAFQDFTHYHSQLKGVSIGQLVSSINFTQLRKNMFEPLGQTQKAIDEYSADLAVSSYIAGKDGKPTGILKGYLEQLDAIRKESVKVLGSLKTLDKVIRSASRQVGGDRQLDQTSGFPNGFSDIVSIPNDLRDPWVKEAVDGQSAALVKAMEDLKIIAEKTRHISGSLKSAAGFSSLMDGVIESSTALSAIPDTFEPLASNLLEVKFSVDLNKVTPPNAEAFASLYSNITSLTNKLVAMDDVLNVVSTLRSKEYVEKLEAMEKLMTDGTDDEVTQRLVDLRKHQGAKDVNKLLLGLKSSLTVLVAPISIDNELEEIEQSFGEIDKFVEGPSHFLGLLSNLRKIKGMDQIKTALDALDQYRGYKQDFGNFGQLKNHVNEATKSLESLSKSFGAMKGAKNPESKSLVQSADVWKDSQTIGSATRVFRGIKLMSEWNKDVMNPAAKALITANSGKMTQEDQKNLKLLDTLDAELKKLKTELTAISWDSVASKTDSNLTSFSPAYSLASKTNGVKCDFKAISDSVDRLARTLKGDKDLLDVKSKLDTLDSMGLDFAKHHSAISGVEKSLENLDKFFASLVEVVVVDDGSGSGGSAGSGTGSRTGSGAGAGDGGGAKEEQSKT